MNLSAESQIWQVPSEGLDVGGLMVRLEKERTEVGIREFGIGITSLEDVFCNIVRRPVPSSCLLSYETEPPHSSVLVPNIRWAYPSTLEETLLPSSRTPATARIASCPPWLGFSIIAS